jgi:hypothetical protein
VLVCRASLASRATDPALDRRAKSVGTQALELRRQLVGQGGCNMHRGERDGPATKTSTKAPTAMPVGQLKRANSASPSRKPFSPLPPIVLTTYRSTVLRCALWGLGFKVRLSSRLGCAVSCSHLRSLALTCSLAVTCSLSGWRTSPTQVALILLLMPVSPAVASKSTQEGTSNLLVSGTRG